MKKLLTVLTVVVVMWAPVKLSAREGAEGQEEGILDLKLTDEQEAKIADIRKEFKPRVQDAAKELSGVVKEEMEKIGGVLTPEQKTQVAAMKDERKEHRAERLAERIAHLEELDLTDAEMTKIADIRKEFRPKIVKALESLKGVLSADQWRAREEALKEGKKRKEVIVALKLTDAQKEKVETVGKELAALVHEQMEKMGQVLSEGQKEKLQEFKDERREHVRDRKAHAAAHAKDLKLTDDQKEKIAAIRKEYRPKVQEAGNKLRAAVGEELVAIGKVLKG
jgi:Spy/CpxP family protein refolding chaperone